ncbi:MAG TPA: hypothetical protein VHO25_15665, partial [Polyangiaceae bacterium]|nr:hypothetical protein [Polyangiaceae bacterium]
PEWVGANHPFHALQALRDRMVPQHQPAAAPSSLLRAACDAQDTDLELTADGAILFGTARLAHLVGGSRLLSPRLALEVDETGHAAQEVQSRLQLFITHRIESLLGKPDELDERLQAAGRGLVYQLRHGLGTVAARDVAALVPTLADDERTVLQRHSIVLGKHFVYSRRALKLPQQNTRRALLRAHLASPQPLPALGQSRVSYPLRGRPPKPIAQACLLLGHPVLGDLAVRVDVIERIANELGTREIQTADLGRVLQLFGCKRSQAVGALAALGYRSAPKSRAKLERV